MKRVQFDLTDPVHTAVWQVAAAREESVESVFITFAYRLIRLMEHDEVGILWAQGFTDQQIANELGWTKIRVATRRQKFQLPANRALKRRPRVVAGA